MDREALARKIDGLPDGPGVYLWKDQAGKVLYVGKAKNLRARVRSYFAQDHYGSPKNQFLVRSIADVDSIVVTNEAQSLLLENNLIKEHRPRFNVRLKDDKSYPSIAVTVKEPFPRVLVTRRRDIPGARYFGPYTDVAEMRRTLSLVRRLFQVRSCQDNLPLDRRDRPCLDFHIGRCLAPCVGLQAEPEYRAMIDEVLRFLEGQTVDVRTKLREMMAAASEREDFERARDLRDALRWLDQIEAPSTVELIGGGDLDVIGYARDGDEAVAVLLRVRDGRLIGRDDRVLENLSDEQDPGIVSQYLIRHYLIQEGRAKRVLLPFAPADFEGLQAIFGPTVEWRIPQRGSGQRWLELADQNARHLLESLRLESFETDERADDPVYALGRSLGMATVPRSMICIDISTNQGRDTVGSLVWFEAGRPKKAEYRKFKIKGAGQQDDFAAINEVVSRYFQRRLDETLPMPDLVVVDGGKGQLSSALAAAQQLGITIPLIGLAKREEEVFLPDQAEPLRLPRRSPALRLLQRIRDEAHRFGLAYNRLRRSNRTITSELLSIPGIGPSRRRALIERFGSLAGVRSATAAEIAAVPGFSATLAERILRQLESGDPSASGRSG